MAAYYLDTSALIKGYVHELGSHWVQTILESDQKHELYTVHIAGAEFFAALYRRLRDKNLSKPMTARLANRFRADLTALYSIVAVDDDLINQAIDLIQKHPLRGYDAVHLAAALELHDFRQRLQLSTLTFVSADGEQLNVAKAAGLQTENPNLYQ